MLILGTDTGLASFGWAVINWEPSRIALVDLGTIVTPSAQSIQQRCSSIRYELKKQAPGCELMALENQERAWAGALERGETNAKALLARVGEGVARGVADELGMDVLELEPQQIRSANGCPVGATKEQLARFALRRVGCGVELVVSNHAKDALATAIAGGARYSVLCRLKAAGGRR